MHDSFDQLIHFFSILVKSMYKVLIRWWIVPSFMVILRFYHFLSQNQFISILFEILWTDLSLIITSWGTEIISEKASPDQNKVFICSISHWATYKCSKIWFKVIWQRLMSVWNHHCRKIARYQKCGCKFHIFVVSWHHAGIQDHNGPWNEQSLIWLMNTSWLEWMNKWDSLLKCSKFMCLIFSRWVFMIWICFQRRWNINKQSRYRLTPRWNFI